MCSCTRGQSTGINTHGAIKKAKELAEKETYKFKDSQKSSNKTIKITIKKNNS